MKCSSDILFKFNNLPLWKLYILEIVLKAFARSLHRNISRIVQCSWLVCIHWRMCLVLITTVRFYPLNPRVPVTLFTNKDECIHRRRKKESQAGYKMASMSNAGSGRTAETRKWKVRRMCKEKDWNVCLIGRKRHRIPIHRNIVL